MKDGISACNGRIFSSTTTTTTTATTTTAIHSISNNNKILQQQQQQQHQQQQPLRQTTTTNEFYRLLCTWFKTKIQLNKIPWEQLRNIKWKNKRATSGNAYIPTEIEHVANVITHGIWIVPAVFATINLINRSNSIEQTWAALVYGSALALLFLISTFFHAIYFFTKHRHLKDVLHRCDRAMIYVFIAGSYFPWLSLSPPVHPTILLILRWAVWLLAGLGILYQQMYHERFKCLETFLYLVMGMGPSLVIILFGHEFHGMSELKLGGLLYLFGVIFFKSDGLIPCAHAIWHLFVVLAASVHYFAIVNYLYPIELK